MVEPLMAESKTLLMLSGDNAGAEQERFLYAIPARCKLVRFLVTSDALATETVNVISTRGNIATGHVISVPGAEDVVVVEAAEMTGYNAANNIMEDGDVLVIDITTALSAEWSITVVLDRVA